MLVRYVAQVRDRGAGRRRQHHVCDGSLPTVTFAELQCERGGADWTDQPVGLPDGHGWLELSSDSCVSRRRQTGCIGKTWLRTGCALFPGKETLQPADQSEDV